MKLSTNPQLELAFEYVQFTNKNIFLTGKAGTGKTTFLHRIKEESIKRTVVVAPTGVAAINARGMTIHSFFQMPFGPFIPDGNQKNEKFQRKFTKKKIALIKSLDLLIIDEISMVRSDMLDGIDDVLKQYRDKTKPFGGVQLLMIGDLHQLPPVVKSEEWDMLRPYYQTPYFFGSLALQQTAPVTIQLTHIYRQSDNTFINLLNRVRDNVLDEQVLNTLNSRYIEDFRPTDEEGYITLTSHNFTANKINDEKLRTIKKDLHQFRAKVDGKFPEHTYPTEETLEFKKGAQVLFIKNDISPEKLFFNGKIGQITNIEEDAIYVKCPGDIDTIKVTPMDWENVKYKLNEETKEVEEELLGTFRQYPLKLAWAITIHKSQGLTFERAIIDANAAFAHGQVYVALSRCKSFEGIVLRSKIDFSSIKTDRVVKNYSEAAEKNPPTETDLLLSKHQFQQVLIRELFDFKNVQRVASRVHHNFVENENTLTKSATEKVVAWTKKANETLFSVGQKFQPQLQTYFANEQLPEENEELQHRIEKACGYFIDKIENEFQPELKKIPVLTDNQKVKKQVKENLQKLNLEFFIKKSCLASAKENFSALEYLKVKTNAELDFIQPKRKASTISKPQTNIVPEDSPHPELYKLLIAWRDKRAKELEKISYQVIALRSILELTKVLPTNARGLVSINGIGKVKVSQFGAEIVDIIEAYCKENSLKTDLLTVASPKPKKPDTKYVSYDLYKSGKTIQEIADNRGLVKSTIVGHLAHYIGLGKVDVFELMEHSKVEEIEAYFSNNKDKSRADAMAHFSGKYSYGDFNLVLKHIESKE